MAIKTNNTKNNGQILNCPLAFYIDIKWPKWLRNKSEYSFLRKETLI